jgi:hypothetical protein
MLHIEQGRRSGHNLHLCHDTSNHVAMGIRRNHHQNTSNKLRWDRWKGEEATMFYVVVFGLVVDDR